MRNINKGGTRSIDPCSEILGKSVLVILQQMLLLPAALHAHFYQSLPISIPLSTPRERDGFMNPHGSRVWVVTGMGTGFKIKPWKKPHPRQGFEGFEGIQPDPK